MFVSRISLPRRTFLRGAGATLALPLLDAMVPAFTAVGRSAAAPVRRLGFVYTPNGYIKEQWTPDLVGAGFELKSSLETLEPFRDQMVIVSGLANLEAEPMGSPPGPHSRGSAAWMTGTHAKFTEGADVRAGRSADQIAAQVLGRDTVLPSLELATEQNEQMVGNCEAGYSCLYQNTISWRNPTTPMPMETHPRVVFQRMFGDGASPEENRRHLQTTGSILDSVTDRLRQLEHALGSGDRHRLGQYFDSVREVESRIQRAEANTADPLLELPPRPSDIPQTFEEHAKLMFDLQVLAYQADITRVIAFQLCRELSPRTYPNLGVSGQHHALSHHGNNPEKIAEVAKIDAYHVELLAYYLDKLRRTPDGDGNLLDTLVLLYGGGLGNPNPHYVVDLPNLVIGGGAGRLKGGHHIAFPVNDNVPQMNLLLGLLAKMDVPLEMLGDSTGPLDLDTPVETAPTVV
ncbi:MAG: DUF1552 domain-containing protein [Acidobacteria bacterium]|nr:DUF1552 domain-containing protein [Acidobacteriota bacterium]MYI75296.1 DUF1552 domain-containing protein [Acidobacteriota bacterium]